MRSPATGAALGAAGHCCAGGMATRRGPESARKAANAAADGGVVKQESVQAKRRMPTPPTPQSVFSRSFATAATWRPPSEGQPEDVEVPKGHRQVNAPYLDPPLGGKKCRTSIRQNFPPDSEKKRRRPEKTSGSKILKTKMIKGWIIHKEIAFAPRVVPEIAFAPRVVLLEHTRTFPFPLPSPIFRMA